MRQQIEHYLKSLRLERNYSAHTLRAYAGDLDAFTRWLQDQDICLTECNTRTIRQFLASLAAAGRSRTTINRRLSSLRSFMSWLDEQGLLATNPAAANQAPKCPRPLPRLVQDSDLDKLLANSSSNKPTDIRDDAIVELMYASGARISELAALSLADIDFVQGSIRLRGKGSKQRLVPLHELALGKLQRYLSQARPQLMRSLIRPRRACVSGDKLLNETALFLGKSGRPLSADSIRVAFKARLRRLGLDTSLAPHDLRHTFATNLLTCGADLRSVQELLGHASLSSTQIYTHLSLTHLKNVAVRAHPRSE
jgi:integrase/recombinase XerD